MSVPVLRCWEDTYTDAHKITRHVGLKCKPFLCGRYDCIALLKQIPMWDSWNILLTFNCLMLCCHGLLHLVLYLLHCSALFQYIKKNNPLLHVYLGRLLPALYSGFKLLPLHHDLEQLLWWQEQWGGQGPHGYEGEDLLDICDTGRLSLEPIQTFLCSLYNHTLLYRVPE